MAGWSCLPPEIKQNVVKKLDFMSRHSLKNVCHTDRQIVNSTPLSIPCVRFGYKQEKCLIVIYTGIEKFLRMEFSKNGENGIIIHKSEDSMDPRLISSKILPTTECPLQMGISILKSLVGHESILIKTLELDITSKKNNSYFLDIFSKQFKNLKFHVEVISLWKVRKVKIFEMTDVLRELCVWKQFKHFKYISLVPSPDNLVPIASTVIYIKTFHFDKPVYFEVFSTRGSVISMGMSELVPLSDPVNGSSPYFLSRAYRKPAEDSKVEIHYEDIGPNNFKIYRQSSECGYWHRKVPEQYEEDLKQWKTQKCGLGDLCSKCADPFDHWYNQMLPRRLLHEPFWAENMIIDKDNIQNNVRLLRNELAMNEKKKEKIQKGKKIQKTSNTPSWGFKQVSIDSLMTSFEGMKRDKNQKKKMNKKKKKMGSEDVKNPEDILKSEDVKEDEVVNVEEIHDNGASGVDLTASEDEDEALNDVIDVKPRINSNHFSTWTMAILLVSLAFNFIVMIIYYLM